MSANRILLDTASYLNSKLIIRSQESLTSKTKIKKESLEGKKTILNDIKDATETYNREYIEREEELKNLKTNSFNTTQDFSLFILFSGFGVFVVSMLVYILRFSTAPVITSIIYLSIITLLYILIVFIIQRFG